MTIMSFLAILDNSKNGMSTMQWKYKKLIDAKNDTKAFRTKYEKTFFISVTKSFLVKIYKGFLWKSNVL